MSDDTALKHTPLDALHRELGARMVPFAGYAMPVQYPSGILAEHQHTRSAAGLFDVSHMGQVRLTARGGKPRQEVARALERLVPAALEDLAPGRMRYTQFTNDAGGILDDLMVTAMGDHLGLIVNAGCKDADLAHLRAHLGEVCEIEYMESRALLALQGPQAVAVFSRHVPEVAQLAFMQAATWTFEGERLQISRSGYTGEDGLEISVPGHAAEALARRLLAEPEVMAIGLGARDSLRLEAGLCLYGHDIDTTTTPGWSGSPWVSANVLRACAPNRPVKSRSCPGVRNCSRKTTTPCSLNRRSISAKVSGVSRPERPAPRISAPIGAGLRTISNSAMCSTGLPLPQFRRCA